MRSGKSLRFFLHTPLFFRTFTVVNQNENDNENENEKSNDKGRTIVPRGATAPGDGGV